MLIVKCDICGIQQETTGYYYDEDPHVALTRNLCHSGSAWEVIQVRMPNTSKTIERDICPSCAEAYRKFLKEQERARYEFFGNSDAEG